MQERTATPSTWTVQAPHNAIPQPNFVPVMPSTSRSTQSSGVSPSTSTPCVPPLTLMLKAMTFSLSSECDGPGSGHVDRNVDVAARGFRIRTDLVRFIQYRPGDVALDTRQADVEAS